MKCGVKLVLEGQRRCCDDGGQKEDSETGFPSEAAYMRETSC